jgi:hypothetical protein
VAAKGEACAGAWLAQRYSSGFGGILGGHDQSALPHHSFDQPPDQRCRHAGYSTYASAPSRAHSLTHLLQAALTQLDGQKVGRQAFATEAEAAQAAARVAAAQLQVASLSSKVSRQPILDSECTVPIIMCNARGTSLPASAVVPL